MTKCTLKKHITIVVLTKAPTLSITFYFTCIRS